MAVMSRDAASFFSLSRIPSALASSAAYILLLAASTVSSASPESITDAVWASKNSKERYRTFIVQWLSLACSTLSTVACLVVLFWFYRMEKRFRHRLIMILMYGDLLKGIWFLVSACVFIMRGSISTASVFCQTSGFFIQYGTQTSDYAILAMAIHSAIEVFYPSTLVSSDGLYPWRYQVYFGALTVPTLMAALAFVNPNSGYWAMGAYCMLPIRPFWYRLALTWIPRYIIVLLIIGLAIAIYTHVGFEFRRYSTISESMKFSVMDMAVPDTLQNTTGPTSERQLDEDRRASSMAHDILSSNRSASFRSMTGQLTRPGQTPLQFPQRAVSLPENMSQISPRPGQIRPVLLPVLSGLSEAHSPTHPRFPAGTDEEPHESITHDSSSRPPSPTASVDAHIARQRRFIARQLRLLFIYPLVYTLMWLIPFIQHCTFYQDKWAQYPMYALRVLNILCITLMGFVDCVIFSMREKPWRSIDNSDGTFWGSLSFRRAYNWEEDRGVTETDTTGRNASLSTHPTMVEGPITGRFRGSLRTSGSDDFSRIAASRARVRLNMEREERKARVRRESTVTEVDVGDSPGPDSPKPEVSREISREIQ